MRGLSGWAALRAGLLSGSSRLVVGSEPDGRQAHRERRGLLCRSGRPPAHWHYRGECWLTCTDSFVKSSRRNVGRNAYIVV